MSESEPMTGNEPATGVEHPDEDGPKTDRRLSSWLLPIVAALTVPVGLVLLYAALVAEGDAPRATVTSVLDPAQPTWQALEPCWRVADDADHSVSFTSGATGSEGTDPVARTEGVDGGLVVGGATVVGGVFSVAVDELQTPDGSGFIPTGLDVGAHPLAIFVLSEPLALPDTPLDAGPITLRLTGELTLNGVSQPLDLDIEATRIGTSPGRLAVTGRGTLDPAARALGPFDTPEGTPVQMVVVLELVADPGSCTDGAWSPSSSQPGES